MMTMADKKRGVETKVCGSPLKRQKHIQGRRPCIMKKLDIKMVQWIIREKHKGGLTNRQIAHNAKITIRWVQKLYQMYKDIDAKEIPDVINTGRHKNGLAGRREHSAVLSARHQYSHGAVGLEKDIEEDMEMHIPHNTIHEILRKNNLASKDPHKNKQRKWVRWERKYSNSLWHTDFKQLDDGKWFISYLDDASRYIVGYGVFENATTEHAIQVLEEAIARHGKPAAILTDHGSQFYANKAECKVRGESEFEHKLVQLDIKHVLARVKHPQTNGKLERFHGTLQRCLPTFESSSVNKTTRSDAGSVGNPFYTKGKRDPVARLIDWYNNDRVHMSLNVDTRETPALAYIHKMPPDGEIVINKETGNEVEI